MSLLYYVFVTLYLIVCLLLLLVVLMQQGKGGDMASAFGGGGSTQTAFGARAGATVLTRATTVLGALFMVGAIILGVFGQRGPGSVLSGVKGSAAPVSTPVSVPAPVKK
jgi:preprotein translocase subunit SecG